MLYETPLEAYLLAWQKFWHESKHVPQLQLLSMHRGMQLTCKYLTLNSSTVALKLTTSIVLDAVFESLKEGINDLETCLKRSLSI